MNEKNSEVEDENNNASLWSPSHITFGSPNSYRGGHSVDDDVPGTTTDPHVKPISYSPTSHDFSAVEDTETPQTPLVLRTSTQLSPVASDNVSHHMLTRRKLFISLVIFTVILVLAVVVGAVLFKVFQTDDGANILISDDPSPTSMSNDLGDDEHGQLHAPFPILLNPAWFPSDIEQADSPDPTLVDLSNDATDVTADATATDSPIIHVLGMDSDDDVTSAAIEDTESSTKKIENSTAVYSQSYLDSLYNQVITFLDFMTKYFGADLDSQPSGNGSIASLDSIWTPDNGTDTEAADMEYTEKIPFTTPDSGIDEVLSTSVPSVVVDGETASSTLQEFVGNKIDENSPSTAANMPEILNTTSVKSVNVHVTESPDHQSEDDTTKTTPPEDVQEVGMEQPNSTEDPKRSTTENMTKILAASEDSNTTMKPSLSKTTVTTRKFDIVDENISMMPDTTQDSRKEAVAAEIANNKTDFTTRETTVEPELHFNEEEQTIFPDITTAAKNLTVLNSDVEENVVESVTEEYDATLDTQLVANTNISKLLNGEDKLTVPSKIPDNVMGSIIPDITTSTVFPDVTTPPPQLNTGKKNPDLSRDDHEVSGRLLEVRNSSLNERSVQEFINTSSKTNEKPPESASLVKNLETTESEGSKQNDDSGQDHTVNSATESCPELQCFDGSGCYLFSQKCDRVVDCKDGSDESDFSNCSCVRMLNFPEVDEFPDCPNGEEDLTACEYPRILCTPRGDRFQKCLPRTIRCDGVPECDDRSDEKGCVRINKNVMDSGVKFVVEPKGYLQIMVKGDWLPVCDNGQRVNRQLQKGCRDIMGHPADRKEMKSLRVVIPSNYTGHFAIKHPATKTFLSVESCPSQLIWSVTCPKPACGLRGPYYYDVNGIVPDRKARFINLDPNKDNGEEEMEFSFSADKRIVGGTDTLPGAFPWSISILRDGEFICGGTILNENWIISASHCFIWNDDRFYEVQVGELRRSSFSPFESSHTVDAIINHPEFNTYTLMHDIVLLHISPPIRLNQWRVPICLPTPYYDAVPEEKCTVVGWGNLQEAGVNANHLQKVDVPIAASCFESYNNDTFQICAAEKEGGKDACQGDSGGALLCERTGQWFIVGIVSHGVGCARAGKQGVYTRVTKYLPWIQQIVSMDMDAMKAAGSLVYWPITECASDLTCHLSAGNCVMKKKVCDGHLNCLGGEDEKNCDVDDEDDSSADNAMDELLEHLFPTLECGQGYVTCSRLPECINETLFCDGKPDCRDSTDEMNCGLAVTYQNRFYPYICDGFVDFSDYSDEAHCGYCSPNEYFCDFTKSCVSYDRVCDKSVDSSFGEDERFCISLAPNEMIKLGIDGYPVRQTSGFVTMLKGRTWMPVCVYDWKELLSQAVCSYMGFKNQKSYSLKAASSRTFSVVNSKNFTSSTDLFPISEERTAGSDTAVQVGTLTEIAETLLQSLSLSPNVSNVEIVQTFQELLNEDTNDTLAQRESSSQCQYVHLECEPEINYGIKILHSKYRGVQMEGPGMWPWHGGVYVDGEYRCAAALIDPHWLLVSQSCVKMIQGYESLVAVLGAWREPSHLAPHSVSIEINYVHPSSRLGVHPLRLISPIEFTPYIVPVLLHNNAYHYDPHDECYLIGREGELLTNNIQLVPISQDSTRVWFSIVGEHTCMEDETSLVYCQSSHHQWYILGPLSPSGRQECSTTARDESVTVVSILRKTSRIQRILQSYSPTECKDGNCSSCKGFLCDHGQCWDHTKVCQNFSSCYGDISKFNEICITEDLPCVEDSTGSCVCGMYEYPCKENRCCQISNFVQANPNATCTQFLSIILPGSLCDGVVDCPDGGDESSGTCGCETFEMWCYESNGCINKRLRCDGTRDCSSGEDEKNCVAISVEKDYIEENILGIPKNTTSGYLMARYHGSWHPYCTEDWNLNNSQKICRYFGFQKGADYTVTDTTEEDERCQLVKLDCSANPVIT